MYAYEDINYESDCCYCSDKQEALDGAKYWFKEVLEILYHKGEIEDLENCLEELGAKFGVNIPETDLQVVRKSRTTDISKILDLWKVENNKHIESLTYRGIHHASI